MANVRDATVEDSLIGCFEILAWGVPTFRSKGDAMYPQLLLLHCLLSALVYVNIRMGLSGALEVFYIDSCCRSLAEINE